MVCCFKNIRLWGVLCFIAVAALVAPRCLALVGKKAETAASRPDAKLDGLLREAEDLRVQKRGPEAVSAYEKVIRAYPDFAEGYFRLGALYYSLGIKGKAQEYYLQAIDRDFKNPEIYFHVGYIKESDGEFQQALEWYLKAEEKGVDNADLYYNIGNVFARMDNKDRALDYYKKTVSINPKHMDAFVNLSVISFHLGRFEDADFYLRKAKDLGYDVPEAYAQSIAAQMKK